jgi:iron complex outermembrane receptor protein
MGTAKHGNTREHLRPSKAGVMGRVGSFGLAAAVLSGGAPAALAQLEEIVVTAERREASLQDTAISISAFTSAELQRAGIQTTEQLTGFTPGLNIQRDVIGKVVIRGIGTENFTVAGDPGVAIMLDDAYLARSSVSIFDLFDLERVEVLRGPQGTLYGRNATGGAMNFISRKPTESLEGYINADFGEYDKQRLEGAVSGPLGKGFSGRVALLSHRRDGFTENVFPGIQNGLGELDDKDLWAARAHLQWEPTEDLSVRLSADAYRDDSNPVPYKYVDDPLVYFGGVPFPNPLAGQLRTVSQGYEFNIPGSDRSLNSANRQDQTGSQLRIDWNLGDGLSLTSITAYRETEFEWLNDGDGIEAYLVNYFQVDESEQVTQELRLASEGERLNWVAGLYYLSEESDSFIGIPVPSGLGLPLAILIDGESETEAYAVFGELSWQLSDELRFTLGARYSYEDKSVFYIDDRTSLGLPLASVDDDDNWSALNPKVGLDYFINDSTMLYASLTQGFKSGGFNMLAIQPSYDEEEVLSFEAGIKTRFAQERVQLNASAFHYWYDDLQVGKVVNLNAVIENAAEATIYGGELELRALVTDQLDVNLAVSVLETEYDEFLSEDKDLPGAPQVDLAGNDLPRSPGLTSSLGATYTVPLAAGQLEFWGNWQYTGSQFFTPFNRATFEQESYSVYNASVTWRAADDRWSVAVYGANIGDEDYFTNALESGVPTPGVDRVVPQFFVGAPQTWGARLQFNF